MAEGITSLPVETRLTITGAFFSVNPVNINTKTTLTVTIEETQMIPGEHWFAGEIYSGEV